jgi:electron transfer flavoprotein beta subunit
LQIVGEALGIEDQFQGVDKLDPLADGSLRVLERIEGGSYQGSLLSGPPAVFGWATGELPEAPNNPQVGMLNMRLVMPALQKAKPAQSLAQAGYQGVQLPKQKRETRVVKDTPVEVIAKEIVDWING